MLEIFLRVTFLLGFAGEHLKSIVFAGGPGFITPSPSSTCLVAKTLGTAGVKQPDYPPLTLDTLTGVVNLS